MIARSTAKPTAALPVDEEGARQLWYLIWWRAARAAAPEGAYLHHYVDAKRKHKDEVWMSASDVICQVYGGINRTGKNVGRIKRKRGCFNRMMYEIDTHFGAIPEEPDDVAWSLAELRERYENTAVVVEGRQGVVTLIQTTPSRNDDYVVIVTWTEAEDDDFVGSFLYSNIGRYLDGSE